MNEFLDEIIALLEIAKSRQGHMVGSHPHEGSHGRGESSSEVGENWLFDYSPIVQELDRVFASHSS